MRIDTKAEHKTAQFRDNVKRAWCSFILLASLGGMILIHNYHTDWAYYVSAGGVCVLAFATGFLHYYTRTKDKAPYDHYKLQPREASARLGMDFGVALFGSNYSDHQRAKWHMERLYEKLCIADQEIPIDVIAFVIRLSEGFGLDATDLCAISRRVEAQMADVKKEEPSNEDYDPSNHHLPGMGRKSV